MSRKPKQPHVVFDDTVRSISNTNPLSLNKMQKFREENKKYYNKSLLYSSDPNYIPATNEDGTSNFHTKYDKQDSEADLYNNIKFGIENNYKHTVLDRKEEQQIEKMKLTSYDNKKNKATFCDDLGRCIIIAGGLYLTGKQLGIIGGKTYKKNKKSKHRKFKHNKTKYNKTKSKQRKQRK
jgi:hypothetical protein